MSLKPLHDRILITPVEPDRFTESGLEIVENWTPQVMGTVRAVGDGEKCRQCGTAAHVDVKVGDVVIFDYHSGQNVTVDGSDYVMMRAGDILAVVEES